MISPIQDIIADLKAGKIVVLVDEEDRENEGDLVMAAEYVTPEAINFMAKFGRGLNCSMTCAQLEPTRSPGSPARRAIATHRDP